MSTATFQSATVGTTPPDPSKHVNYTEGMVLGVDDFTQEFAYLSNRDQWLARDTIGYGTVSGLHVALTPKDGDMEVSVSPGVAINPRGQFISVVSRQCARLGAWLDLASTQARLAELGLGGGSALTAYVVLCYRDCPTDQLPVPGEPCRCDSDTLAASRVMDDFRLELSLTPPPQREEDAVRDFVTWLREIKVADFTPAPGDLDTFLDDLRAATGGDDGSPPQSPPDFFYGSPPASVRIPREEACAWLRAAMRLWVTELRPKWQARCAPRAACGCTGDCGCHGTGAEPDDMACDCVLLAEVSFMLGGGGVSGATLSEERRPFLLHLRLLQELLLCGPCTCGSDPIRARTFATVFALDDSTLRVWVHYPVALDVSEPALTLRLDDVATAGFIIAPGDGPNVFDLVLDDSPPGPFQISTRIEIDFDANQISEAGGRLLAVALREDDYNYLDYHDSILPAFGVALAVPPPAPPPALVHLSGDVTGDPSANRIAQLQGSPVQADAPAQDSVLRFDNGAWRAELLPVAPAIKGPYVEHPANAPGYSIVAAGILRAGGETVDPSYNNLKVSTLPGSPLSGIALITNMLLTFSGYVMPTAARDSHMYIVKATPFEAAPETPFYVISFQKEGIVIPPVVRGKAAFMIEISMFALSGEGTPK